jgi:hypothetical protein
MGNSDRLVDELEQKKDIQGLIETLKHPEEGMRIRAANALGRVGDARAIPALTTALHDEAVTDPAEVFRGNAAWEELGSSDLIYYVRNAAWDALKMIWSRNITTFEEPIPGMNPFEAGDIVAQWRKPDNDMKGARWKVLFISRKEVELELVEGVYEEPRQGKRGIRYYPGYVIRVSSSVEYMNNYLGTKVNQYAFSTYRKVKLISPI